MAFDLLTRKESGRDWSCGGGFSDDARKAMSTAPDYFVWWYTVKSVGLGVVAAGLAFMLGRASCKPKRS
jgi:hypothetical protein